jgi:hypothetical protein
MKGVEKQNVFVREFPGKPVFEQYYGVPAERFMEEAQKTVEQFQKSHNGMFSLRSLTGRDYASTLKVERHGDTLCVNGMCLKPTKWGIDDVGTVFRSKRRLWFFDQETLQELNIECD